MSIAKGKPAVRGPFNPPVIEQDELDPVSPKILAKSIISISASMKKLLSSGLNRRAVIALVHDHTKLGKSEITRVLDALDDLARTYTT
jgi:hypothetical protein